MSGEHGHDVSVDEIRSALEPTRKLRLGLDVLWEHLPQDMESGAIGDALWMIHERLRSDELRALRTWGLPRAYVIISPINPRNPPGPGDMEKIADAIRTLDDLGLIVVP
jgi:hypothetical protein